MVKEGDLVKHDGWYGIISSLEKKAVFCGNGCDTLLNDNEFAALEPISDNNFIELVRFYQLRYDSSVKIARQSAEYED